GVLGVSLDDGEDVVEIVRYTGRELTDTLQLLRVPKLSFQIQHVRDVRAVAMHDLASGYRKEGPTDRSLIHRDFLAELVFPALEAFANQFGGIFRQRMKHLLLL